MAGLNALLRDLHRMHRLAGDLREHLDRLPSQIKVQKTRAARHDQALLEGQDKLKHLKVNIHEKGITLETTMQQIAKYEGQLNTVTAMKEYRALQTEIGTAREQCGKLEDEILQAMTETDDLKAALPGLEQAARNAREELARFEATAKEKQASVTVELTDVQGKLKEAESGLPEEIRTLYDRLVNAMGADALTPVRDRTCSSCSTEITAQNANDLLRDRFLICRSCGRIFYLPGEPEA